MTTNNEIRLRKDMQVFKSVNRKQRDQYMIDRLKHIKDCVKDYNKNLLPGETEIDIFEMGEQLGRKC